MEPSTLTVGRVAGISGRLRPPSDKSLTHRAYLFAALAEDTGTPNLVRNPLDGEDCFSTLSCLEELGNEAEYFPAGHLGELPMTIIGKGSEWATPDVPLDCGNSGTTMRLLAGAVASKPGLTVQLMGDESLSRRPMGRIAEPLRVMGAIVEGDRPPLLIEGRPLRAMEYASPVASAQVKSCVLLAGLRARGTTWFKEPSLSRDHTERMLEALGVEIQRREDGCIGVDAGQTWAPFEFDVPADVSSAAFFLVGAALLPGSRLHLDSVGVNPTRTGVLEVLEAAGVAIGLEAPREELGEPVANLVVTGRSGLGAFEVSGRLVPRLIDEIPVLAVLATQCEGVSRFRDAAELRVKESDRIEAVATGLRAMGATVETHPDGLDVRGPVRLKGASVEAGGDHRIAMAFAIAGLVAEGPTVVHGAETIKTSYPRFQSDLAALAQD